MSKHQNQDYDRESKLSALHEAEGRDEKRSEESKTLPDQEIPLGLIVDGEDGEQKLSHKGRAHFPVGPRKEESAAWHHMDQIIRNTRAMGYEIPKGFEFRAGQIFYECRAVVEVRLRGVCPGGDKWSTPVEPCISAIFPETALTNRPYLFDEVNDDADRHRAHLSAIVIIDPDIDRPCSLTVAWDLRDNVPNSMLEKTGAQVFPQAFGTTYADSRSLDFISHVHRLRLPRQLSKIPRLEKLKEQEIQRILDEKGEDAFKDLRKETGNKQERGALLKWRYKTDNARAPVLTAEAEKFLKIHAGLLRGYLERRKDGLEYLVRIFPAGNGYVSVGFSWYGLAGPLFEEWRQARQIELEKRSQESQVLPPLKELTDEGQHKMELLMRRLQAVKDGSRIMEAVLGELGRSACNPVEISAIAFRALIDPEGRDKNWRSRLNGGLNALTACRFEYQSINVQHGTGAGNFLGEWDYRGRGHGSHGDGYYLLDVQPGFIGCLSAFERDRWVGSDGKMITTYNFSRRLTAEEKRDWKEEKKSFTTFDAGRVYFDAAQGFTPERRRLHAFLEANITRNKDGVSKKLGNDPKKRKEIQYQLRRQPEGEAPRLYDRSFCPFLPSYIEFEGALGRYPNNKNPETGRKLYGTETAVGRALGILAILGYPIRPGLAYRNRSETVRRALEDMKAVVVDYLNGVVAALDKQQRWLTLDESSRLPENDLKKIKWFFFLPKDWREHRTRKWEAQTGFTATKSTTEAAQIRRYGTIQLQIEPESGDSDSDHYKFGLHELHHRLRATRLERKMSQQALANLFGVSKMSISQWERGVEPNDNGKVTGKPIPLELTTYILRWIHTGTPPTMEELATRKTRRSGKPE